MYHQNLKLGFIGLGKYGFSTAKAILESGHHNIENLYFEEIDVASLRELSVEKRAEIHNNYENLKKILSRLINYDNREKNKANHEDHILKINELIEKVCQNQYSRGALVISLDISRGKKLLKEIADIRNGNTFKDLWIISSVSKLDASMIKQLTNENVKVIRYVQNMAISVGQGIISAYIEPGYREEGEAIIKRVFQGCGKVILLNEETFIDSARIITASPIGLFAYFAKILSDSIKELGIKDFEEKADEIVYYSIAGMLLLCKHKEFENWDVLLKQLMVTPGSFGQPGTIEFITNYLDSKNISQIIKDSINTCHKEYFHNNQKIEA